MGKISGMGVGMVAMVLSSCTTGVTDTAAPQWEPIFDGETLQGWMPKIAGQALGEDSGSIFRVENGAITVSYDGYSRFSGEFGHLFFAEPLSDYRLRFSYMFNGEQISGGPGWAFMNSGVMVHAQAPETMRDDQPFPVSVEAQLLGSASATPGRTTANICTPGTHVVIDGTLTRKHCITSQTLARPADTWVNAEIEVRGGDLIVLRIDGEEAFRLTDPEFDRDDTDVSGLGLRGPVESGYFALQAESHPVKFRDIELLRLPADAP